VFEGGLQQIWQLAHSNSTSCAQVSKRLVAYIEALLVLSPYWSLRPSDLRIAAIADARFNCSTQPWPASTSFQTSISRHQALVLEHNSCRSSVTKRQMKTAFWPASLTASQEDEEAASVAAAAAAKAAAKAAAAAQPEAAAAQAVVAANTPS
jgi:hypothetical protein